MSTPNNDENVKWLYDKLKSKGYEIGDEEQFASSLANQEDRDWYYDKAKSIGLNMGTKEQFENAYAPKQAAQPAQKQPAQQNGLKSAGWATVDPFGGWSRNQQERQEEQSAQQQAKQQQTTKQQTASQQPATTTAQQPARQSKAATKPQGTPMTEQERMAMMFNVGGIVNQSNAYVNSAKQHISDVQKHGGSNKTVSLGKRYNPETQKMEETYMTPTGQETTDKAAADKVALDYRVRQGFFQRMKDNGLDPENAADQQKQHELDIAEPVRNTVAELWNEAEAKHRADVDKSEAEIQRNDHTSMISGQGQTMFNVGQRYGAKTRSHLTRFDLEKMMDDAWERIGTDKQQEYTNMMYDALKRDGANAGKSDAELRKAAQQAAREYSDSIVYQYAVKQNTPKSTLDFFTQKVADSNMLSSITKGILREQVGASGDMAAHDVAMEEAGKENRWTNVAGTVVGMAADPTMYVGGGFGGLLAKGAMAGAGRLMLRGAAAGVGRRYAQSTLAGRIVGGVVGGAGNLGFFEGAKNLEQQFQYGGSVDLSTGKTADYSFSNVLSSLGHGMMMGSVTGVASSLIGNFADKAVKAVNSTAGKIGTRAGFTAISTTAEGTIFAMPEMIQNGQWDWDVWWDSEALMLGFKAQHAPKSAKKILKALENDGKRYGLSFEEKFRQQLDASPADFGFTKEELTELREKGYGDLALLFADASNEKAAKAKSKTKNLPVEASKVIDDSGVHNTIMPEGYDGYRDMEKLMADNRVSEAARARAYYILTGRMLPMSTITGYTMDTAADGSVVVSSTNAQGGVVTSRRFANEGAAKQEIDNIMRQAELNSVNVGEQYRTDAANKAVIKSAIEDVAPNGDPKYLTRIYEMYQRGEKVGDNNEAICKKIDEYLASGNYEKKEIVTAISDVMNGADFLTTEDGAMKLEDVARVYDAYKRGEITEGEGYELGKTIDSTIESNRVTAGYVRPETIRERLNKESGLDVDASLRKIPSERTAEEQDLVNRYLKQLFPEQERNERGQTREEADEEMQRLVDMRQQSHDEGEQVYEQAEQTGDTSAADAVLQREKDAREEIHNVFADRSEEILATMDENPISALNTYGGDNPAERDAMLEYINAKAALDGLVEASDNSAEGKRAEAQHKVEQHTNKQTGMVHPAVMKVGDRKVYIVSGEVQMFPDGTDVDAEHSSPSIIICDAETGELSFTSPDRILSVGAPISAEDELRAVDETITAEQQAIVGDAAVPTTQVEGKPVQPQDTQEDVPQDETMAPTTPTTPIPPTTPPTTPTAGAPAVEVPTAETPETPTETSATAPTESALTRIAKDEEGAPLLEQADAETAWDAAVEYFDNDENDAISYVQSMVEQLGKEAKKAADAVGKVKPTGSMAKFKADKAAARQAQADIETRLAQWQSIAGVKEARQNAALEQAATERLEADRIAHEQAKAEIAEQQRIAAEQQAEQEAIGANAVHPKIKEKWDNAKKYVGAEDVKILPDGTRLKGHYVLFEAGATTPSHDINNGFAPSEGFPVGKDGTTVNDRDYQRDKDAQNKVIDVAGDYDGRALQDMPTSQEGTVIDGNNRTMSRLMAAQNGTDGKYIADLSRSAQKYGLTPEQVAEFQHPTVNFVLDEPLPYDTTTFARFNAQEKKSQSKPEQAVKMGKVVPDKTFNIITQSLAQYDKLADFYADQNASNAAINELLRAGVINDMQLPELRTGNTLSAQGKELLENTLIGKVFEGSPDSVRQLIAMPNVKQSVVMGMAEIAHNRTLKGGYDLSEELAAAVDLVARAKASDKDGKVFGEGKAISPFGDQPGLFDGELGDSTVREATIRMLADILNSLKPSDLRNVLATYNQEASMAASGQMDMFSGGVRSKEEILTDIINQYKNATTKERKAMADAGIADRKRQAAESGGGGGTGEQAAAVETGGGQPQQPVGRTSSAEEVQAQREATNGTPTEGQKKAGNYAKGHIKVDGYDISIENPKGSTRSGQDANGKTWSIEMKHDYGYIKRTEGVDGDHIDVYLSDNPTGGNVYVVDQIDQRTGAFDEHKVMYGFDSMEEAEQAYRDQYEDGWKVGKITEVSREEFKKWIESSHRKTKPFAEYAKVKKLGEQEAEQAAPYTITPTTYTNKKGKTSNVHLVKFNGELSEAQRKAAKAFIGEPLQEGRRTSRGWYDSKQGGYMMRSEEAAKQLAKMLSDESAVADTQPVTLSDARAASGKGKPKPQPKPANTVTIEDAAKEGQPQEPQPQEPKKDNLQFNGEVTKEEFEDADKMIRDLLGIGDDEGEGFHFRDPDELTKQQKVQLKMAGMSVTQILIENGNVNFGDYARIMVEKYSDKVRPYLKSWYEGTRYEPGNEKYGFSPIDEVARFDVMNFDKPSADLLEQARRAVEQKKAEEADKEASAEIQKSRNDKRKEDEQQTAADTAAIAEEAGVVASEAQSVAESATDEREIKDASDKVDGALEKVNDQLALLGYYEADEVESDFNEQYGYMRNAEKKAVKDAARLGKSLAEDLGVDLYEATHAAPDKKGKRKSKPLAVANIAPAGGEIAVNLPYAEVGGIGLVITLDPSTTDPVTGERISYMQGTNHHIYYDDLAVKKVIIHAGQTRRLYGAGVTYERLVAHFRGVIDLEKKRLAKQGIQGNPQPVIKEPKGKDVPARPAANAEGATPTAKDFPADAVVIELPETWVGKTFFTNGMRLKCTGVDHGMADFDNLDMMMGQSHEISTVQDWLREGQMAAMRPEGSDGKDETKPATSGTPLMSDTGTPSDEQVVRAATGKTFIAKDGSGNTMKVLGIVTGQAKFIVTDKDGKTEGFTSSIPAMADALQRWEEVAESSKPAEKGAADTNNGGKPSASGENPVSLPQGGKQPTKPTTPAKKPGKKGKPQPQQTMGDLFGDLFADNTETKPTNNGNDTTEPRGDEAQGGANRPVGSVSADGNGVLGPEVAGADNGGQPAANGAGGKGLADGQPSVLSPVGSRGGRTGEPDGTSTGKPNSTNGGSSVAAGGHETGRGSVGGTSKGGSPSTKQDGDHRVDDGSVKTPNERNNPKNTRNYLYGPDAEDIDNMSPKQRLNTNVEALEALVKVLQEKRDATPEERAILGRFRGWGGVDLTRFYSQDQLAGAGKWEVGPNDYARLGKVLKILDPDGKRGIFKDIKHASLTSYYTPLPIARVMNDFLVQAGYRGGGSMLDPSIGNGVFEGTLPKSVQQRTNIYGVELDWLTAQIAKQLYPDAHIENNGFERAELTPGAYDIVESNIPFGQIRVTDPSWERNSSPVRRAAQNRIHNYFAVKMMEVAKPGGLVTIMTSNAIMDTKGNAIIRNELLRQGEFLGAIRLPNNVFKGAGTAVVTDVIFMRKWRNDVDFETTSAKPEYQSRVEVFTHPATLTAHNSTEHRDYDVELNGYYTANPHMMIGDVVAGGQYRSDEFGLTSKDDVNTIAKAMARLIKNDIVGGRKGTLYDTTKPEREIHQAIREAYIGDGNYNSSGNIVEQNGKFGTLNVTGKDNTLMFEENPELKKNADRIKLYIPIRTAFKKLTAAQINREKEGRINILRKELNDAYKAFVDKYGRLNDKANNFIEADIDSYQMRGLEDIDAETGQVRKLADIFTKNTIKPTLDMNSATTLSSAIATSLAGYGEIRPSYMEKVLGENWRDQCHGTLYRIPNSDNYVVADDYLSGDVKTKLEEARAAARLDASYNENVEALEKVQPEDIVITDINIRMGARWVPDDIYTDFMRDMLGVDGYRGRQMKSGVRYIPESDDFIVHVDKNELGGNADRWSTDRKSAKDIFEAAMKDKPVAVYDKDDYGRPVLNESETEAANDKVQELRETFEVWVSSEPERSDRLARDYNDKFNRTVIRKWNADFMEPVGLQGKTLRPHQKAAVWMLLNNRGGIVDHIVGAGKTLVMQSAIMEMRRMGIAKKPMILALKATCGQIAKEFSQAYPSARILAPTEKDFSVKNRKKLLAKIASNDYDCVIISHEQYKRLPHTQEIETQTINEQLAQLEAAIMLLQNASDKSELTKRQLKGLERRKTNLEAKLKKMMERSVDREFCFENLGVDYLFVDECQHFKSLPYATTYGQVAGLGDPDGSENAIALLNGVRYLQKLHQGDRGTVFLSGTTVTNSLVEVYNLLNYLRPNTMQKLGYTTFDAWAAQYAVKSKEQEFGVTNELKAKTRFRSFQNVGELGKMYAEIADVRNDMNLELPKPKPNAHLVKVESSSMQDEINAEVIKMVHSMDGRYFGIYPKGDPKNEPWSLHASRISESAAINPRLVLASASDDDGGKIPVVCENVAKLYKQFNDDKGTQLIFCDKGVPNAKRKYDVYNDLINRLVNEYGIPRNEIVDIHTADNDAKKKELFKKMNDGVVRILIGGTKNMGTGVNVQNRLVGEHHVDMPWTPADREQRNGRGVRQGNWLAKEKNDNKVELFYYATEGSLDMYKYQLQQIKGDMFNKFKTATINSDEREFDEGADTEGGLDPAEMVAILSGNPIIFDKSKQDKLVKKLLRQKSAEQNDYARRKKLYEDAQKQKENFQRLADQNAKDIKAIEDRGFVRQDSGAYPTTVEVRTDRWVPGKTFEKAAETGKYIHDLLKEGKGVYLKGFGVMARVEGDTEGGDLFKRQLAAIEIGDNRWDNIRYTVNLSENDQAAGLAFRNLLERIVKNKDVYAQKLEDANRKLQGSETLGEYKFSKEKELQEALAKKKEIDAEYKKLSADNKPSEQEDTGKKPQFAIQPYREDLTPRERVLGGIAVDMLHAAGVDVVLDEGEMRAAMNEGGQRQEHAVYHGSAADFDAFDHSHMGEGEGAQAYGWGTYVTEVEGIGKTYAEASSWKKGTGKDSAYNEKIRNHINEKYGIGDIRYDIYFNKNYYDIFHFRYSDEQKAISAAREYYRKHPKEIGFNKKHIDNKNYANVLLYDFEKAIKDECREMLENPEKYLYSVDIPDNNGNNYLEYAKDLTKEELRQIVERLLKVKDKAWTKEDKDWLASRWEEWYADSMRDFGKYRGEDFLEMLGMGVDGRTSGGKKTSRILSKAGYVGVEYPAQFRSGGREDNAKNYVIFKETDAKITKKTQFLRTPNGEVFGFVKDGKVYLDPKQLNANTPNHEYTHLWDAALRRNNPELWKRGVELMKQTSLWEQVKNDPAYKDIADNDDLVASEVHSRLTGAKAEETMKKLAEGMVTPEGKSLIARLRDWLNKAWQWVKDTMAPWTKEEASKVTLDDFVNMPLRDLANGKNVSELAKVRSQKTPGRVTDVSSREDVTNPIQFLVGRKRREEMERRLAKHRPDITEEQRAALFGVLDGIEDTKTENAAFGWFLNGTVRLPEDMEKIRQAVDVAGKAKVDPMQYKSPMELLEQHANFKASEARINPDNVPTLHKEKDYGNGIVTYNVEDSQKSRENMRQIINTHYGKDASPWCLLQGDGEGNLREDSKGYWNYYNRYPKRVAFKDGKLLAFFASDGEPTWWDRQDEPHRGIPVRRKMDDDGERTATYEYNEQHRAFDAPTNITRGNKQNGLYEEWKDKNTLTLQANYKGGVLNGAYKKWYDDGQLERQCTYKDGMPDGSYKEWHKNGQPRLACTYKDGKFEGEHKTWFINGSLWEQEFYKDGKREGESKHWFSNGRLQLQCSYKNGKTDGEYKQWHLSGELEEQCTYKNGELDGEFKSWYRDGTPEEESVYKDGFYDGEVKKWNRDGVLIEQASYKTGKLNGERKQWYNDGTPKYQINFKDGEVEGEYKSWYENGNLQEQSHHKNGISDGEFSLFYENGQQMVQGSYKHGEYDGELKKWYENGVLLGRSNYKNGVLDGECRTWGYDGEPHIHRLYKNGEVVREFNNDWLHFRTVDDEHVLNFLNGQPTRKGFRYAQWANYGILPPMTAKKDGQWRAPMIMSRWEQSEEGMRKENGKADLVQGNGRTTGDVAYNPYFHIRENAVNDQFTAAYDRPELIVIEGEYPESELTSGYQAEGAKDPVGRLAWHSGGFNAQLSDDTKVNTILSRYFKPGRIVPWSEVADQWVNDVIKGQKVEVPINTVPPMLRAELAKRGVKFGPVSGQVSKKDAAMLEDLRKRVNKGEWDAGLEKARAYLDAYESSDEGKEARVNYISELLHTPVRIVRADEAKDLPSRRQRGAKGWWNERTGEVVVVLPNNVNVADVDNTVIHEVVGHKGLRDFIGADRYDAFLDEVHDHATDAIRKKIDDMLDKRVAAEVDRLTRQKNAEADRPNDRRGIFARAEATIEAEQKREQYRREATDEYMAQVAGKIGNEGFEKMEAEELTFWGKVKAKVQQFLDRFLQGLGIAKSVKLTDKDIAYILYKSWKNLKNGGKPSIMERAEDVVMREKLGYDADEQARFRDGDMGLDETITSLKADLASKNTEDREARIAAMKAIGGNLSKLRSAMSKQRTYDISTAKSMTDLAKTLLSKGLLDGMSTYETKRVLSAIQSGVGKEDISKSVQSLMDIMVDNQLRSGETMLGKMFSVRGSKVNDKGVEVQDGLDITGQELVKAAKKYTKYSLTEIDDDLTPELMERMASDNKVVADNAATEYAGAQIARRYVEEIAESKKEERRIRESIGTARENMEAGKMTKDEFWQYVRTVEDAVREMKIERAEAYADIAEQFGGTLGASAERAKAWREAEQDRINEIHHNCNSDMFGRPHDEHHKETKVQKFVNNDIVRLLLNPLTTFDMMCRMFGKNSVNGEGYLYNRFVRGCVDARNAEITGYRTAIKELDAKVSEVFGKKKKWSDLYSMERKMPKMSVEFWDGGQRKLHELTQGNMLYIYMCDKMTDGAMKLRSMGITEEDVAEIASQIDPRFKQLADWMQDEYLVEKRNKYNEVHKRMFGAPMAAIEHYFPLKILQNSLDKEEDVAQDDNAGIVLPGTTTGGVIKRKRNNKPLDVTGADAFNVILDHLQEMEHWSAFAEITRDINTMLSYKHFRNQVMNMTSAYGAGKVLWKNFRDTCKLAVGAYRPQEGGGLDRTAVNLAKGVTAAKVNFRLYTAMKQLLSAPAYIPDTNPLYLAKNVVNPVGAWKWSMENLPIFEERWRSRIAGDPRLMKSEKDWKAWRSEAVQIASRIGMSPNAFVDAVTVSIGAYSIYETNYAKYKRWGFDDATADKRAKQDAIIKFNETQQSSEGLFVSPMQMDRTWLSSLFTIFRNASMSYTRQVHDAMRNEVKLFTPGYRERSQAYMEKQLIRQGLSEEQAKKAARSELRKGPLHNLARIFIFGNFLPTLWNLGGVLPYILLGDDDEQKDDMINDAVTHGLFGPIEGLTGGDVMSNAGNMLLSGEGVSQYLEKNMPIVEDTKKVWEKWPKDKVAAMNDVVGILMQINFGVNPQSITDAVVAVWDACGDDAQTARECALLITRILNCPQSQIDKIYFDELGVDGVTASKMSPQQIADRYARYKRRRNAPLTGWMYDEAGKEAVEGKQKEKVLDKAKESFGVATDGEDRTSLDAWREEYNKTRKEVERINKIEDWAEANEQFNALYETPEYKRYESFNFYKNDINELTKEWLRAETAEERQQATDSMKTLKRKLVDELKAVEKQ